MMQKAVKLAVKITGYETTLLTHRVNWELDRQIVERGFVKD